MNNQGVRSAILARLQMHTTEARSILSRAQDSAFPPGRLTLRRLARTEQQLRGATAFADSLLRDLELVNELDKTQRHQVLSEARTVADKIQHALIKLGD
jgi:hypothetical protein